jgi:hypothetical protein
VIRALVVLSLLASCEYRRDLGDVEDPLDAGSEEHVTGCAGFEIPLDDCTVPATECLGDFGCEPGQNCNSFLGRCYPEDVSCAGTQCTFDEDCGTWATCNEPAGICFDPRESQACMPCIGNDDCGAGQCELVTGRCID